MREEWALQNHADDVNVKWYNSRSTPPAKALRNLQLANMIMRQLVIETHDCKEDVKNLALLEKNVVRGNLLAIGLSDDDLDLQNATDCIARATGRINAAAPVLGMSLAINGTSGTLELVAELLHFDSPLKAELMTIYSQVSLGSYVDNKEGPPGTGKSYIKAMTCLVFEIVKLCREDKPRVGEEITVIQSAGNAATIEFMKKIVQIVTMEAPVTCSTGRLPAATQKNKTVSSPLDANPKIIKKVDTVAITHGSLERECTKLRPAFNLTSIVRDIIDEKQMSAGCGDVCTTPIVDQLVRKMEGSKKR